MYIRPVIVVFFHIIIHIDIKKLYQVRNKALDKLFLFLVEKTSPDEGGDI